MMLAYLRAPKPGDIAFCLVCAGAIRAIRLAMIDPFHLEARMKIIPSPCLVGVDDASSGDASAKRRTSSRVIGDPPEDAMARAVRSE